MHAAPDVDELLTRSSLTLLQVVFIDQNRDLWTRSIVGQRPAVKLAAMVECVQWHDSAGMLAYIADHKLVRLLGSHHLWQCAM